MSQFRGDPVSSEEKRIKWDNVGWAALARAYRLARHLTRVCHQKLSALSRGLGRYIVLLLHHLAQRGQIGRVRSSRNAASCGAQTPDFRRLRGSEVERPIGLEPTTFSLGSRGSSVAGGEQRSACNVSRRRP